MPITINDCAKCGSEPVIMPTRRNDDDFVYLICPQIGSHNCTSLHFFGNRAVEEWNEANPRREDADND